MTATTMVTLDEVLRAAGNRKAALAPETSGYFALAIGDATSRLPLGIDDRAVALTTEGTVLVPRKGNLVAPAEAARILRDALARLLAVSAGSMPGLAAAARPRTEADVDGVVASIEAALIPVNRSAARRALAGLARETLRAKEMGKLGAVRAIAPIPDAAPIAAAAPAELAPRVAPAVYLTGMGVEVLIEASRTPEPYVLVEVAVEAAPQEPEAPAPIATLAPADPSVELAPASAASIEAIEAIAAEADIADDDDEMSVPPSRETTPTLLGVGDVGVYITAALSPAPSEVEEDRSDLTEPCSFASSEMDATEVEEEQEAIASIRRTISGLGDSSTARFVDEAVEAAAAAAAADIEAAVAFAKAEEAAEPEPLEAIAADLSDVPTAAAVTFEEEDATTNALPFVLVVEKEECAPAEEAVAPEPIPAPPPPLRRPAARRKHGHADLANAAASDVDDLLSRFNVGGVRDEHRIAQSLKSFAGIELTAAPPITWESPRPRAAVDPGPASTSGWESSPPPATARAGRATRFGYAISAAILAICLVGTSMLWRFRPDLFGGTSAPHAAPEKLSPPARPASPPSEPHADFDP